MKTFFKNPLVYVVLVILLFGLGTLTIHWSMVDDGKSAQVADQITTSIKHLDYRLFTNSVLEPDTGRFRPAYWVYQWLTFVVGGSSALNHHLIHLLVFVICSYGLYKIAFYLFKSSLVAVIASFLFIADSLTLENWYRLGPQEPILIALLLVTTFAYWKYRTSRKFNYLLISSVAFILATLTKETAMAYLGVVLTFLVLDLTSGHTRNYAKRDLIYLSVITLIVFATRFLAFKAYPLVGYAALYKLDFSILTNALAFYKVICNTYGPLLQLLFILFVIRFVSSIKTKGLVKTIPEFYWQTISLSWFFSFLAIQLPWLFTLGRYLHPAFLGLFVFIASEFVINIEALERVILENRKIGNRLDIYWLISLVKSLMYFILVVIFVRTVIVDISYYAWVKGISDFDYNLVSQIVPYAQESRKIYFNADKAGEPMLEIFEEIRWHLIYIYGVKNLSFDYLPKNYLPMKGDIVVTHNYKQVIPVEKLLSDFGFSDIQDKQVDINGVVVTTPFQIIKSIPSVLFGLSIEKPQLHNLYAVAKYSYTWRIYEQK